MLNRLLLAPLLPHDIPTVQFSRVQAAKRAPTYHAHLASVHKKGLEYNEPGCNFTTSYMTPGVLTRHFRRCHTEYFRHFGCVRRCGHIYDEPFEKGY